MQFCRSGAILHRLFHISDLHILGIPQVTQLTGFSDPVYAEAYVHINQYDIVLDVLIVNQTTDTLQNCTLELATLGDLKLVEKPQPVVLAPHDFCNIKANVKVASTENGFIFGNIGMYSFECLKSFLEQNSWNLLHMTYCACNVISFPKPYIPLLKTAHYTS